MYFIEYKQLKISLYTALAAVLLWPILYSGNDQLSDLEKAQQRGSLTLLTRNGASTYFIGPDGAMGPEHDLAAAYADYLGLDLEVAVADEFSDLGSLLQRRQGDLIGANLTRTRERERTFNFGPDYAETKTLVVYRNGATRPRDLFDLVGQRVAVIAGSSYEAQLEEASKSLPGLQWSAQTNAGIEDLLIAIAEGELDATLVDSSIFRINSQFYPRVRAGFTLPGAQQHAWAFLPGNDDSLVQKARSFFRLTRENGTLALILGQYEDDNHRLDRVGM